MPTVRRPRKGSLQFWPRRRHRGTITVRSHIDKKDALPLGFAGFKVGMTHLIVTDNRVASTTKKMQISIPVTILECPPIKVFAIRFYKKDAYGLHVITEIHDKNPDKFLKRKLTPAKKPSDAEAPKDFSEVRLLVHTQPRLANFGQKRPQIFEMYLGGKADVQFTNAKALLGKELNVSDTIKPGNQMDVHAVTKGKGFAGEVKRHGVTIRQHKSEKRKRGKAQLGPWTPAKVSYTIPQTGKMGHHLRTEYNKWIIAVDVNPEKIQQLGGFVHYGVVKNPYVLVKGSVAGPRKALVKLMPAIRPDALIPVQAPQIMHISTEAKQ